MSLLESSFNSEWNGDKVKKTFKDACHTGINKVMADCVGYSKANHSGWQNRTGLAEGSIKIQAFAQERGGSIIGIWGSADVGYMIWLEYKHGSSLRRSADINYRKLDEYLKKASKKTLN